MAEWGHAVIAARSPQPLPIASISPTQFAVLSSCVCQAAFGRDPSFADLGRSSPAAAMGTAAHAVLEAAYRGELGSADDPKRAALSVWDRIIEELAGGNDNPFWPHRDDPVGPTRSAWSVPAGASLRGPGETEAVGVAAGLDDVGAKGEPVDDGGGESGVGEGLAP